MTDKWHGKPPYERPLGATSEGVDDGREAVWITDFSACEPAAHLAEWSLIDYANDDFSGQLLYAKADRPGSDLTIELNVTGWYAVYVWLMGGDCGMPYAQGHCDSVYSLSRGPSLKLTDDRYRMCSFSTMSHDMMMWKGLEACFWQYTDLTKQTLSIKHQGSTVYLGAIELVPLSPAEVAAIEADRADASNKRLIVKSDAYVEATRRVFYEVARNTDVTAWMVSCHDSEDLATPGGPPTLKRLRQDTAELGIEAYACDRPSLWGHMIRSDDPREIIFEQNPEWHCLDRDGTDTYQASYAHPEVQAYMLERARAAASAGIDGYGYFLCRDPGMILFEPVAMAGFEEKHGVDPCTLADRDERLLDWRADILTEFMRRMRQVLDEVATENGFERIKIVHTVLGGEAANRFFSFDVPRWVREGLIDIVCPYPWTDYPDRWLAQGFVEVDVAYYTELCKDTDVTVFPMWLTSANPTLYGWVSEHVRSNEYFKKAIADYDAGADGISTWDAVGLALFYPFMASRWLRLGHKEQLAAWAENDFPLPQKLRFTRYAGKTPSRYPAGTGG
jgi:hypothetical protein